MGESRRTLTLTPILALASTLTPTLTPTRWEKATEDWHLTQRVSQSRSPSRDSRSPSSPSLRSFSPSLRPKTQSPSLRPSQPKPPRRRRFSRERMGHGMDGSRHGASSVLNSSSHGSMDRSLHGVGFQLEPTAPQPRSEGHEGRTTAPLTVEVTASEGGGHGHSTAAPASWLHLATDDPENQFHEIFTFDDDDGSGPLKRDSSRLLILTSIEGGQHKQPPLFKRRGTTACNPTC